MNIIVTGATGMVGAEVVRQAVKDPAINRITTLSRKPVEITDPKINQVIHNDFLDYSKLSGLFAESDACLWCLGISQLQVSKEMYHTITYDYTIAAATAMIAANPSMAFVFVSGGGADSTEKSRTIFARVKGKTENALQRLSISKLIIVRPGGIRPVTKNKNMPVAYKLLLPLFPIMEWITPSKVINSVQLAKALIHVAKNGADKLILENIDLKAIALATLR